MNHGQEDPTKTESCAKSRTWMAKGDVRPHQANEHPHQDNNVDVRLHPQFTVTGRQFKNFTVYDCPQQAKVTGKCLGEGSPMAIETNKATLEVNTK